MCTVVLYLPSFHSSCTNEGYFNKLAWELLQQIVSFSFPCPECQHRFKINPTPSCVLWVSHHTPSQAHDTSPMAADSHHRIPDHWPIFGLHDMWFNLTNQCILHKLTTVSSSHGKVPIFESTHYLWWTFVWSPSTTHLYIYYWYNAEWSLFGFKDRAVVLRNIWFHGSLCFLLFFKIFKYT